MVDKIKPLKYETSSDGTELDYLPTEADPTEDYVAVKGIAFENSNNTIIRGDSGVMKFKDSILTSEKSLNQLRTAIDNSFDNSSNGFTATNVQTAIEEARSTAQGKIRIPIISSYNGVTTDRFLQFFGNVNSNESPYVIADARKIVNLSVAFKRVTTCYMEIFKNGNFVTPIYSWTITNSITSYISGLSIQLSAGDYISTYVKKYTTPAPQNNPEDPIFVIECQSN